MYFCLFPGLYASRSKLWVAPITINKKTPQRLEWLRSIMTDGGVMSGTHIVWHIGRQRNGKLYQSGYLALFMPGSLEYELVYALLLYGIGVGRVVGQHLAYLGLCVLRVIGV